MGEKEYTAERLKYLTLLAEGYPTVQALCTEIVNLEAHLALPKGTEHFMSDIHGEYEAFCHILNNCSGVIREKVNMLFSGTMTGREISGLCTLIYYPQEKLKRLKKAKAAYPGMVPPHPAGDDCAQQTAFLQIYPGAGAQGYAGGICLFAGRTASRPGG